MQISWGYKISILYIGFVALILSMVFLASRQKFDLVSTDYYEQELKYQNKINKANRTTLLNEPLTWEVKKNLLDLKFPQQFKGKKINGTINFFRPSDSAMDKTFPVSPDSLGLQSVSTILLKKGFYKIQINWKVDKEEYYNEGTIQIN